MICNYHFFVLFVWAGMVGTVVRSLLSYHKVPSLIGALPRSEYLGELLFRLS